MPTVARILPFRALAACFLLISASHEAMAQPQIAPDYVGTLGIQAVAAGTGTIAQMSWGPDGRLYAARFDGGVISFQYDSATGQLGDRREASSLNGLGIAFHAGRGEMYQSSGGAIWRLTDDNSNGVWGESGETRVAIVSGIPTGDHDVDQIQIRGDTLYVGIGDRTINGGTGVNTGLVIDDTGGSGMAFGGVGNTFGESAYGGTIATIRDLTKVASTTDSARLLGPVNQATIQTDGSPYTGNADDKLIVHSAGARNPFGLALDRDGQLFFTNNSNRANTNGDGTATRGLYADALDSNFRDDVHDQFFKAVQGGDYGFRNENWRGVRDPNVLASILDKTAPGHIEVDSITPDNLHSSDPNYLALHDPSHPVGLGPHSSADGFDFWYNPLLPSELYGDAFVTRYTGTLREASPGTDVLDYRDLVAADPLTGEVRRIATDFNSPLAVLAATDGRLLVADFGFGAGAGAIYAIGVQAVPEPSTIALILIGLPAFLLLAKKSRGDRPTRRPPPAA